jgi:hypothetical protein
MSTIQCPFKLFFFLLFFSLNVFSAENFNNEDLALELDCNTSLFDDFVTATHPSFIDLTINKYRKWNKNYLNLLKNSHKYIPNEFKQKFKAHLSVTFTNGLNCRFPAEIRVNGYHRNHISNLVPITSLDVKLLQGNIDSITQFKLLLPNTINGDDEIFNSTILREFGFLSPKAYYVPVNFNNQTVKLIFQEKITKEFIEANKLREAPILEGDKRFLFIKKPFNSLSRMVNYKWAVGNVNFDISRDAVSSLNRNYLEGLEGFPLLLNDKLDSNKMNESFALLVALESKNGFQFENQTFYYDRIYKKFIPIYYDEMSNKLNTNKDTYKNLFTSKHGFNSDQVKGAKRVIVSIKALDKKRFMKQLNKYGLNVSSQKLNEKIDVINSNLQIISNAEDQNKVGPYKQYFSKVKDSAKKLVFINDGLKVEICNFSMSSCIFEQLDLKEYSKLLGGQYKNKNGIDYIFVGNKIEYENGLILQNNNSSKFKSINFDKDSNIITYGQIESDINNNSKVINFYQKELNSRVLITGGRLKNWKINFFGVKKLPIENNQRFDENLLTGCLSFIDMNIENLDIKVNNSSCEDAINFIRVSGNVNNIEIHNSNSDGLDVDYSEIDFGDIVIFNAGNDCIDFSFGEYTVQYANLNHCSDKAISAGEKTSASLNSIEVLNSSIGIASKDSSLVKIEKILFNNAKNCFSAYNKKQEFWGAKIIVNEHNCQPIRKYQQKYSLIEVMN